MSVNALLKQITELPEVEREELLDRLDDLYGEVDVDAPIEISEGMRQLLEERDAEYEANPDDVYTWEEVVAYVKRKK